MGKEKHSFRIKGSYGRANEVMYDTLDDYARNPRYRKVRAFLEELDILAFPIMLIVTIVQWLFIFLVSFSSVVFYLLAGIFLLVAALSLIFGIATWPEALRAILAGFIVFMIPVIGEGITAIIAVFREELSDFIRS